MPFLLCRRRERESESWSKTCVSVFGLRSVNGNGTGIGNRNESRIVVCVVGSDYETCFASQSDQTYTEREKKSLRGEKQGVKN